MIFFPLVLIALVAALLVWTLYKVTVYALPCILGLGLARMALDTGAGLVGSAIVGGAGAVASFYLLRMVLAQLPSGPARSILATILIVPSLILGYNIGIDVLKDVVPSETWRHVISITYASFGGWVAFIRLTETEASDW